MMKRKESLIQKAFGDGEFKADEELLQSETLEHLSPIDVKRTEILHWRDLRDQVDNAFRQQDLTNPNEPKARSVQPATSDRTTTESSAKRLVSSILAKELKIFDSLLSEIDDLPAALHIVEEHLKLSESPYDAALLYFVQARSVLSTAQLNRDMTGFRQLEKAFWAGCFNYPEMHELVRNVYTSCLLQGHTMPFQLLHDEALRTATVESTASGQQQNVVIPTSYELVPPKSRRWPDLNILNRTRKAIHAYERKVWQGVETGALDEKQASFAYYNLTTLCESPAELVTCFIISAMWALQAIEKQQHELDQVKKLHMANVVVQCVEQAIISCNANYFAPALKYHVNRIAYALTKRTNECTGLAAAANSALNCLKAVVFFAPLSPLSQPAVVAVCEAQKFFDAYTQLYVSYIKHVKTNLTPSERPFSSTKLNYFLFELALTCETSGISVSYSHAEAIQSALDAYYVSNEEFKSFTEAGYTSENHWPAESTAALPYCQLFSKSECYVDISGFCFDGETGELDIQGTVACTLDDALITVEDLFVAILASKENELPFFSLENPEPFFDLSAVQYYRYGPRSLAGSGVLNTMFFADYLLKQFSMGTEVCAVEPFEIRKAQAIYQGLPAETVNKLKPLNQRCATSYQARLWIQVDTVDYDVQQQGSLTTIVVSDPKIIVKSKSTFVGVDGETHDELKPPDTHDVHAWRQQNQVLQSFCDDFTECYDVLCSKYPQLRRLQKLAKLHEACRLLERLAQGNAALRYVFDNIYDAAKKSREDVKHSDIEIVPAVLVCRRGASSYVYGGVSLDATTRTQKPLAYTGQRIPLKSRLTDLCQSASAFAARKSESLQAANKATGNKSSAE